jgi:DNA helicase IV
MNLNKDALLQKLRDHIASIQAHIVKVREDLVSIGNKSVREVRSLAVEDRMTHWQITYYKDQRIEELRQLEQSPYFMKCEIKYDGKDEIKTVYFSKFQLIEQAIYSWIAPVSTVRFEKPGPFSFTLPDGRKRSGTLLSKDQYLIVDGKPVFFATESLSYPRTLIHQEHFSAKKQGFVLPEIVELMEKAQDQVVRASPRGSLVIGGPAGSGKTTLALHRIAYLLQSPDTARLYDPSAICILVQDAGSKEYFSGLLPELGIKYVQISTFAEWARAILEIEESARYVHSYEVAGVDTYAYEQKKLASLRSAVSVVYTKSPFMYLERKYSDTFSAEERAVFAEQKKGQIFDRIDLTILLAKYFEKNESFALTEKRTVYTEAGKLVSRTRKKKIAHSIILVDEFQNYLPEQLSLLKNALDKDNGSMLYIGDLAQQIRLGSLRKWNEISEDILVDRNIRLQKVYRNTKQILQYVREVGFIVTIPEEIKEGSVVVEKMFQSSHEEVEYINSILKNDIFSSVGILAKNKEYLEIFKTAFGGQPEIHILSIHEAQGLEFECVFLVGSGHFDVGHIQGYEEFLQAEVKKIYKDLLYIGLTRSMSALHVLGDRKLASVFPGLSGERESLE